MIACVRIAKEWGRVSKGVKLLGKERALRFSKKYKKADVATNT